MEHRNIKLVFSHIIEYLTGLVDFGEEGEKGKTFSDKANHGLVFMFIPLEDNYAQPVGVFASKGPTKGVVLTQLVIKAITVLEKAGAFIHGIMELYVMGQPQIENFGAKWEYVEILIKLKIGLSTQQMKNEKYMCSLIHHIYLRISEIGSIIIKSSRFVVLLIYFNIKFV